MLGYYFHARIPLETNCFFQQNVCPIKTTAKHNLSIIPFLYSIILLFFNTALPSHLYFAILTSFDINIHDEVVHQDFAVYLDCRGNIDCKIFPN